MDKVLAAVIGLSALYLVISICYYLRLDRLVDKARFCIKNMSNAIEEWLNTAELMVGESGFSAQQTRFLQLRAEYNNIRKFRDLTGRVDIINKIHSVVSETVPNSVGNEYYANCRNVLAVYALNLDPLRLEYNNCADELKRRRTVTFFGWIANLTKLPYLSKLHDFEI